MNKRVVHYLIVAGVVGVSLPAARLLAEQASQQAKQTVATSERTPQTTSGSPSARTDAFGPNVRVDVTITDQGTSGNAAPIRKTISLTAASSINRTNSSVRSGVNVPVPNTTMGAAAAGGLNTIPVTSYSYRTMGLSLDLREVEVRENQVRVALTVEYSPLDETAEKPATPVTSPVSYSNFSQSFQLVLDNGKPITAAETSDPVPNRNRRLSVEVKATILR